MSSREYNTVLLAPPHFTPYILGPSPNFKVGEIITLLASATLAQQAPEIHKLTPWGIWQITTILWNRDHTGWTQQLYVQQADLDFNI